MIVGMVAPFIFFFVVVFILLLFLMNKSFSFVKFYFTIVAIISVIGMAVAFGIVIYQQGMQLLISDTEYLNGRNAREIQQCDEPMWKAGPTGTDEQIARTPAEKESCKQQAVARVQQQRSFDVKESTIGGLTWGIIFLILFLTHFPRMIAFQEQETPSAKRNVPVKRSTKKIA